MSVGKGLDPGLVGRVFGAEQPTFRPTVNIQAVVDLVVLDVLLLRRLQWAAGVAGVIIQLVLLRGLRVQRAVIHMKVLHRRRSVRRRIVGRLLLLIIHHDVHGFVDYLDLDELLLLQRIQRHE